MMKRSWDDDDDAEKEGGTGREGSRGYVGRGPLRSRGVVQVAWYSAQNKNKK